VVRWVTMGEAQPVRRKTIRTGLGVLLLALSLRGFWTTIHPGPGDERAENGGELAGMLCVDLALLGGGVYLVAEGRRRQRDADSRED